MIEMISLYTIVSSAYRHMFHWILSLMSFMQRRNNAGPRTEPWGTPDLTVPHVECNPFTETVWTLLRRKSFIHVKVDPLMQQKHNCTERRR